MKDENGDDSLKDTLQMALDNDKNLRSYGLRVDVVEGKRSTSWNC